MLDFLGRSTTLCSGLSRRSFLSAGTLGFGMGGLSLAGLLRAEDRAGKGSSHKGLINIFLGGGPPHQDMWDLKVDAPSEIRGEFNPIHTNVPGIDICEVFPQLATRMDKSVILRSIVGCLDRHESDQCMSGWFPEDLRALGGRPCIGSAVSKLHGPVDAAIPPFVGLAAKTSHVPWSHSGGAGFLGAAHSAFKPDGPGMANMKLNGVSMDRLQDRRKLLASIDTMRRDIDTSGIMAGMDAFEQRALDVLTSSKLLDALDLSQEDPEVLQRYGDGKPYKYQYDGAPTCNEHFLLARRLIEAGVRVVSLSYGRWDSHGDNFGMVRDHGGKMDQCLSALIDDLHDRRMLDDVTVIVWGEFGRTPKINNTAGRDHWTQVNSAFMVGGGMRTGQVIGATNRLGEYASERPIHMQEVIATLYHNLGINSSAVTIPDPTGRPQFLVDHEPIRELI